MSRLSALLIAATAALLSGSVVLTSTSALAASLSQRECEASGGTYTKNGPDATCVDQVANDNASPNNNSQTTTTTGQGNLDNKATCSGPPGQC